MSKWSPQEIQLLTTQYKAGYNREAIIKALPNRDFDAILVKATRLKITSKSNQPSTKLKCVHPGCGRSIHARTFRKRKPEYKIPYCCYHLKAGRAKDD